MLQCLKRQHLQAAGLDAAPRAIACLAPAPQPQTCPAGAPTCGCCHPTAGTCQSHGDPTTSLPHRWGWGSSWSLINPPAPNRPQGLAGEQIPHQGSARSRVTLGLAGTQSAAGGFARIGRCTGSYMGLVSAWILTWDRSTTGFSPGIGQHLDSHLGLVSAWILRWD